MIEIIGEMEVDDRTCAMYQNNENKLIIFHQQLYGIPRSLINRYKHRLRHIDLSTSSITDLNWISQFPFLETLNVDNNGLRDSVFLKLCKEGNLKFENIKTLSFNNNKFENLYLVLLVLAEYFPNLEYLSLLGNPACPDGLSLKRTNQLSYEEYSEEVCNIMPHIRFLDYTKVPGPPSDCYADPNFLPLELKTPFRSLLSKFIRGSKCRHRPVANRTFFTRI